MARLRAHDRVAPASRQVREETMAETSGASGRLTGRRIVITGAASGIGRRTAQLFAAEGAALTLLDRDAGHPSAATAATGGLAVAADVTDEASVMAAVEQG